MNDIKQNYKKTKKGLKTNYKTEKKKLKTNYKNKKEELSNKVLPSNEETPPTRYTKGEEIFNMVSHIVGGALGIIALIVTLVLSIKKQDSISIFASVVYSLSLIILYTMSSIYHGLSPRLYKAKDIFRKFDYISIFILISGSYTVFLLEVLRPADPKSAWILFAAMWTATAIGAVLNSINVRKFIVVSNIAYLLMGWSIVWKFKIIKSLMHPLGFLFLLLGGIAYTIGVIFYIIGKKKKWMHSIFHLFILAGSILHFISIVGYVL